MTASTQGIGFAIALRLAQEGGIVHICSRKEKNVIEAVQYLGVLGFSKNVFGHTCNVGNKADRQKMI